MSMELRRFSIHERKTKYPFFVVSKAFQHYEHRYRYQEYGKHRILEDPCLAQKQERNYIAPMNEARRFSLRSCSAASTLGGRCRPGGCEG